MYSSLGSKTTVPGARGLRRQKGKLTVEDPDIGQNWVLDLSTSDVGIPVFPQQKPDISKLKFNFKYVGACPPEGRPLDWELTWGYISSDVKANGLSFSVITYFNVIDFEHTEGRNQHFRDIASAWKSYLKDIHQDSLLQIPNPVPNVTSGFGIPPTTGQNYGLQSAKHMESSGSYFLDLSSGWQGNSNAEIRDPSLDIGYPSTQVPTNTEYSTNFGHRNNWDPPAIPATKKKGKKVVRFEGQTGAISDPRNYDHTMPEAVVNWFNKTLQTNAMAPELPTFFHSAGRMTSVGLGRRPPPQFRSTYPQLPTFQSPPPDKSFSCEVDHSLLGSGPNQGNRRARCRRSGSMHARVCCQIGNRPECQPRG